MPDRSSKRPRDLNQLAKSLVDDSTGEDRAAPERQEPEKDPRLRSWGAEAG